MKRFFVIGCHRSATSLIAKGLHDNDIPMGDDLLPADPTQPHGYYEDTAGMRLNEQILTALGGSWDDPPARNHVIHFQYPLLDEYIAARDAAGHDWGFKDPRLCVLWPIWLRYLTARGLDDTHIITVRRRGKFIFDSLERRGDGRRAHQIVDRYLEDLDQIARDPYTIAP